MPDPSRYAFSFGPGSPYAKAVGLLVDHGPSSGLVVDLGCGFGPAAEPLAEHGYGYVGFDAEPAGVEDLRRRGFSAEVVDVSSADRLVAQLEASADGGQVAGVLALDVLEHLSDPWEIASALAAWLGRHADAVLVWSIPNVAHLDVASKLLAGRFELTDTGLLDRTHLRFFTEASVAELARRAGFVEVGSDDVLLGVSDQHWPRTHPFLRPGAPASSILGWLRSRAEAAGSVNQFVRCYRPAPVPDGTGTPPATARSGARAIVLAAAVGSEACLPASLEPRSLGALATEPGELRRALADLPAPWLAVPVGPPGPAVLAEVVRRAVADPEPDGAGVCLITPQAPARCLPWPLAFAEPGALVRGSVLLVERSLLAELELPVAEAEVVDALWRLLVECAVVAGLDEDVVTTGPDLRPPSFRLERWAFLEPDPALLSALVATSPVLLPPGGASALLQLAAATRLAPPDQPSTKRRRSALERWLSRSASGLR